MGNTIFMAAPSFYRDSKPKPKKEYPIEEIPNECRWAYDSYQNCMGRDGNCEGPKDLYLKCKQRITKSTSVYEDDWTHTSD